MTSIENSLEAKKYISTCVLTAMVHRVTSLRDVVLLVQPEIIIRGGTAALICSRDMQGAPLYSVKWYRGNHEFYRYTPMEEPDTRVFGLPGIYVDVNEPIERDPGAAPETGPQSRWQLQLRRPVLLADKDSYQPGEVLRANCTSSPSKPPANLTIYINEEPVHIFPSSGLLWTTVKSEVAVTSELFHSGRMRVACRASVYNVNTQPGCVHELPKLDHLPTPHFTAGEESSVHALKTPLNRIMN
ncbi:Uncharacterized protein OBRU01_01237, partial [Operophtera brumata]